MTRKRGRGSRFQVWVAVPVIGVLTGAGLPAAGDSLLTSSEPAPTGAAAAAAV